MRSIASKYTLILIIVSLLGVVSVVVYASYVIENEFSKFLFRQEQDEIIEKLIEIYTAHDGWEGITSREINSLTENNSPRLFSVLDNEGYVVIPSATNKNGAKLPQKQASEGTPIEVDGNIVGSIVNTGGNPRSNLTESFSQTINQSLIFGGVAAIVLSLIVGITFSFGLTKRIRMLSKAAKSIAQGEFKEKIEVKSKDEISDLAETFNQMSAKLDRMQTMRRQMTADIAHELRTPLSIILGRAETLARGILKPTQEVYEVIYSESLRMNRLVEDLRTLSLTDACELKLEKSSVNIHSFLDEIINKHENQAVGKRITINAYFQNQIPEIQADPDRLKQVFNNLINNAIRHTQKKGEIFIICERLENNIIIRIKDTGSGIPKEDLPYIFDRFYRGDKARERDNGGSGLGLAIAKSLVEAHNGTIDVISVLDEGTQFLISLPIGITD